MTKCTEINWEHFSDKIYLKYFPYTCANLSFLMTFLFYRPGWKNNNKKSSMKFCRHPNVFIKFKGSGVCGTWDINSGPHFVPGLQIVPKSPDKYDYVNDWIFCVFVAHCLDERCELSKRNRFNFMLTYFGNRFSFKCSLKGMSLW